MTNDEIGQELVDRLNEVLTAAGLSADSGAGLLLEEDVHRAIALHSGLPAEVVENLIKAQIEVGLNGVMLGASLQQAMGGVATQAMLLGALAAKP